MIEKLRKKISNYFSPEDRFIHSFDKAHPEETSPLKQQEIEKHARIAKLRDNENAADTNASDEKSWWTDF